MAIRLRSWLRRYALAFLLLLPASFSYSESNWKAFAFTKSYYGALKTGVTNLVRRPSDYPSALSRRGMGRAAFSEDGGKIAWRGPEGNMKFFDLDTGALIETYWGGEEKNTTPQEPVFMAWAPAGRLSLSSAKGMEIKKRQYPWDDLKGASLRGIRSMAFSSMNSMLLVEDAGGNLSLWEQGLRRPARDLPPLQGAATASLQGSLITALGEKAAIWNMEEKKKVRNLRSENGLIHLAALLSGGVETLAVKTGQRLEFREIPEGDKVPVIDSKSEMTYSVVFLKESPLTLSGNGGVFNIKPNY